MSLKPQRPNYPKPLLKRKLTPMRDPAQKRTTSTRKVFQEASATEMPQTGKSSMRLQPSRSGTGSRKAATSGNEVPLNVEKVTREGACVATLQSGFPQSYIDLFYLTHGKFSDLEIKTESDITELKERLTNAEKLFQEGDFPESFRVYHELGGYFEKTRENYDSATYFYKRCDELAGKNQLYSEQTTALVGLGNCAYKTSNIESAINFYEKGIKIAEFHDLKHSLYTISKSLTEVYRLEAEKLEFNGRTDEALENYLKCLEAAKTSEDKIAQGNACYQIGLIFFKKEEYEAALEYLEEYLKHSRAVNYTEGITSALAKLANVHQAMGEIQTAIEELEQLNKEASDNDRQEAQAEATLNLGLLYQQQENHDLAVNYLRKHYELARKLQDRTLIDSASVSLGMAEAACAASKFSELISDDFEKLLQWKVKRTKF